MDIDFAERVTRWSRSVSNEMHKDRTTDRQRADAYGDKLIEAGLLLLEAGEKLNPTLEEGRNDEHK